MQQHWLLHWLGYSENCKAIKESKFSDMNLERAILFFIKAGAGMFYFYD